MPRKRDPSVFTTSVSGIPDEAWAGFRQAVKSWRENKDSKYTLRQALEEAIMGLHDRFYEHAQGPWGAGITWIPAGHAKPVPIQISETTRDALRKLAGRTGYKQNVIILTAMSYHGQRLASHASAGSATPPLFPGLGPGKGVRVGG